MATEKERKLIREITDLALDIGAGDYDVSIDYSGHVHSFCVRVALRGSSDWVYYSDSAYLSGRKDIWTEKASLPLLNEMLAQVKAFHPQYDADGVEL